MARVTTVALWLAIAAVPPIASGQRLPTPESGIGVWYAPGAHAVTKLWQPGDQGERLFLRGRVVDTRGRTVEEAMVELWHADANGVVHEHRYRTALPTRANGEFQISTVLPGYIWGPRHIHVVVSHPGHERLITRIFFMRDPVLAESGNPQLAIVLEDGRLEDEHVLIGAIELVLRPAGSRADPGR